MSKTLPDLHKTTILKGIVHPRGSGGVQFKGKPWRFQIELITWRGEDGSIYDGDLRLSMEVTKDELEEYRRWVKPYAIIEARVMFTSADTADLIDLLNLSVTDDEVLLQRVTELQKPVTHVNQRFGTLILDRSVNWYEGTMTWLGKSVRLVTIGRSNTEIEAALQVATALWDDEGTWNRRIQDYAVQKCLVIKNSNWLQEGETPLSADDFKAQMILETIEVFPNGRFEFWHESDIFGDHAIVVIGDLINGPTDLDTPG